MLQAGKKNFLRIEDPKLNKVFWWVGAAILAIAVIVVVIILIANISYDVAAPGHDLSSYLPVNSFVLKMFAATLILFTAFLTIVFYVLGTNWEKSIEAKRTAKVDSPLNDAAKGHEQQIINLMIAVIKPVPGKNIISHAETAKFIKALKELNLMNVNLKGQHLIPWIESVTDYSAGKASPFNQALKAVKLDDEDVPKYKAQLEQILAS